jgi:acyl transferase domain-containing protein
MEEETMREQISEQDVERAERYAEAMDRAAKAVEHLPDRKYLEELGEQAQDLAEAMAQGTSARRLWISAADTPHRNQYGLVVVVAESKEEAVAKARAFLESDEARSTYVPEERYREALLLDLDHNMRSAGEVFVDWSPSRPRD